MHVLPMVDIFTMC